MKHFPTAHQTNRLRTSGRPRARHGVRRARACTKARPGTTRRAVEDGTSPGQLHAAARGMLLHCDTIYYTFTIQISGLLSLSLTTPAGTPPLLLTVVETLEYNLPSRTTTI